MPADDLERACRGCRRHVDSDRGRREPLQLSHFRDYLQRGACSIVQVDVARIGGITPWLKIAHMAEAFNMRSARIS